MKSSETAISFWLDDFDDIYSDFDSRHYLKRRISEDFLHEVVLSLHHKEIKSNDLVLFLPSKKRNLEVELNITSSLTSYFQKQYSLHKEQYQKTFRKGIYMLLSGIVLMIVNFFLSYKYRQSVALSLLRVLAEPGSWFLIWAGLDTLYYDLSVIRKERDQFGLLSQIKIHFHSAE